MASRGVHFALDDVTSQRLLAAAGDDEALMAVIEELEEAWDADHLAESDKAWDAIHRCLTDGQLLYENGEYPLNRAIAGGRQLHRGDEYTVSYVPASEVKDVSAALNTVTAEWFRERYLTILPKDYSPNYGVEDLDYTLSWLEDVKALFSRAASEGRAVVFTVDA
jgi:Domain of unknown function (DUF1877)